MVMIMAAKRYRVHNWVKFNYSEIGEYIDENHTDKPLRNDEIVDLLNHLSDENEKLNEQIYFLLMDLMRTKSYKQLEKDNKRLKQAYNDAKKDVEKKEQILKDIMEDNLLIQDIEKELEE